MNPWSQYVPKFPTTTALFLIEIVLISFLLALHNMNMLHKFSNFDQEKKRLWYVKLLIFNICLKIDLSIFEHREVHLLIKDF